MNLKHVISDIVANLARWEKTGLNEAQTRQVMVLRLFQALGYDIWNPFEVIAEQNSGGGSGSYIPDFTLCVANKNAFIVEVKALGKDFGNNDRTQAVNYVNSMGLRWAILTNGKQWLFFDNEQKAVAADKLAMTINLTTPYAANSLETLLSPTVWKSDDADQTVWQAIQFLKLESKLRQIMQKGFARDRDGLELAIEVRLNADERQLAESRFEALCQRILSVEPTSPMPLPVSGTSVLPARETKETSFPLPIAAPVVVSSQAEILQVLREQIELVSQTTSTHGFDITARLNGVEIRVKGWRDIVTGIAETFIRLGREGEIQEYIYDFPREIKRGKQQGKTDSSRYRQLSNSKYLHLDFTVEDHKEHANNWLNKLQVPPKVLAVTYKDETYYLPLPTSTTAVLPARGMKESAFSLPISSPRPVIVNSQAEILQVLREQIELATESFSSRESGLTAVKLDGAEIKANNWRDILTGIAETFIRLDRMEGIQNHILVYDSPEKRESGYRYRQLSNGKYLRFDWCANDLKKHINKWLRKLQVPPKVLAVTYKDETYYLPLSASTTAVLPARETKKTSFPLPILSPRSTVVKSQTEILQLLREQIELVSQTTLTHGFDITARLDGVEIKANTWRNILTGFAETFISLGREGEIQDHIYDSQERRESDYSFRQLSNSKYLRVPGAYQNYKRHLNKWLKILQLPPEILAVTYKGETYYLPL